MHGEDDFRQAAFEALSSPSPEDELCALVRREIDGGTDSEHLLGLERLRGELDAQREDVVLNVMDTLAGWCSPHMRL